MTDVPEHDDADELECKVATDGTGTVAERQAMLDVLRRMRAGYPSSSGADGDSTSRHPRSGDQ